MLKCPFCGFGNEDGALFCEQCKSDLSAVAPAAHEDRADEVPMAAVVEDDVPMAAMVEAEAAHAFAFSNEPMEVVEAQIVPAPEDVPSPPLGPYNAAAEADPPHAIAAEVELPESQAADFERAHETPVLELPPMAHVAPPPEPMAVAAPVEVVPPTPAPVAIPTAAVASPSAAPAVPPAAPAAKLPAGAQPKLVVVRGQKLNMEFPIYPSENYIGRADDKPVDIDLEDQEPPERVWCSRQHALIVYDEAAGTLTIEDLNSANGTFVNRGRVYPGQPRPLQLNDVVQIGNVHLKLKV